jgi:hypothetical protein
LAAIQPTDKTNCPIARLADIDKRVQCVTLIPVQRLNLTIGKLDSVAANTGRCLNQIERIGITAAAIGK